MGRTVVATVRLHLHPTTLIKKDTIPATIVGVIGGGSGVHVHARDQVANISTQEGVGTMIHPKAPERIRIDALRRGAEKQLAGCVTCAEAHFILARRHGASEEEIRSAL